MAQRYAIPNIEEFIRNRAFPTIVSWNRLEGRPRTANFDRALKAEVRDALWMLTRQWQMGEFQGDDAGSPVFAKLHLDVTRLTKYQANSQQVPTPTAEVFNNTIPLESRVEHRPIPFVLESQNISLDLRLLMGRQWLKLLRSVPSVASFTQAYINHNNYEITRPDPTQGSESYLCAHQEVWQTFAAVAGRCMDGYALYQYLKTPANPTHHAYDDIPGITGNESVIDTLATKFIRWFETLYDQPTNTDAWASSRLEYQFSCSAPSSTSEKVYTAEEYYQGHLDWYNLDIDSTSTGLGSTSAQTTDPRRTDTQTLIPTPVSFAGMPNTRWWTFEDNKTNFGDIKPETTDLAKLLLIEFGLVYANDWFLIPYTLPVGSISNIRGMVVTNVFGERTWVGAAGNIVSNASKGWSMFTSSAKDNADKISDTSLLLLPTVPKIQEGDPLESVWLVRDEVANMVWAIETIIPLATGSSKSGSEAAIEIHNYYQRLIDDALDVNPSRMPGLHYLLTTSVPENWIPFIPVHLNDNREVQLQRAAMPRILENSSVDPERVRPRTALMRSGLEHQTILSNATPRREPYYIYEEEVPRAGIRVAQSFQRTRWSDGQACVWLGVKKQIGRGEGSSGLEFDRIIHVEP